jgi:VWFA-related protein
VLLAFVAAGALAQSFQERVRVELVRVELLATDRQGRPLISLSPAEIQVKVDGKPVPIESFEAPTPSLPEIPAAAAPPAPLPSAPRLGVSPTPPPLPLARHPYYMAFLVDETSSEQSNRQTVYKQLFEFFQKPLPPDVEILLMRFNGALHIETPWTSDAGRLRGGLAAMSRRKAAPLLGSPGQLSDNPEQGQFNLQLEAIDAVIHVRTSLAGLFDALRVFPESPGRKSLFVVTDGAPFLAPAEIAKDLIATSPSTNVPGAVHRSLEEPDYDRDLLADSLAWSRSRSASMLTEVTRLAVLRDIEVHPVRSAAHDFDGRVRADRGFHERARAPSRKPLETPRDAAAPPTTDIAAGQGMEATAETTGGDAILSRRFIQDGVRREVSLRDAAYALSFRDPFAGDHRFHKIEVASQKQGVQLRYRRGYRVLDTRESLVQGITNRLQLPADENPLGVRLQLDSLGKESGNAVAEITVAYPAPPEAGGRASAEGTVRILGVCAVRNGRLSDPIDLSGKPEQTRIGETAWLVRSGRVSVKPGSYRWSFAVRDDQTGITSYLTFDRALP